MVNDKAVIDGVKYLADTYCGGEASGVMITPDGDYLNVWLAADKQRVFSDADEVAMKAFGFHCYNNTDKWPDLSRYSHFYKKV